MAEIKTKATIASVAQFLGRVEPETKREDAKQIAAMMQRLSGYEPVMWGPSIVGFGSYHYRYDSGHEGDMARIGFSPRKDALTLYVVDSFDQYADLMARLGKYKTGKCCLYVKKLADIDLAVLEELIIASLACMDRKYPR
ncbi:DUF1801 domain-containing protein [Sphingomonas cavernae]|uniref:DUF1801 domain-containing protein n=1 Tax=Sphingomonas cavernae TaxID=2320861 RepID=A0A418WR16_9SPHN|nr:DUF1801 domain-containing protein [Sphingomonas cavernae]RJF93688.1 DUF1801 domain-containing protein [Sphingomonas cavernae]